MSSNWNQPPEDKRNADGDNPPKTGGLLSKYKGQDASQGTPPSSQVSRGQSASASSQPAAGGKEKTGLLSGGYGKGAQESGVNQSQQAPVQQNQQKKSTGLLSGAQQQQAAQQNQQKKATGLLSGAQQQQAAQQNQQKKGTGLLSGAQQQQAVQQNQQKKATGLLSGAQQQQAVQQNQQKKATGLLSGAQQQQAAQQNQQKKGTGLLSGAQQQQAVQQNQQKKGTGLLSSAQQQQAVQQSQQKKATGLLSNWNNQPLQGALLSRGQEFVNHMRQFSGKMAVLAGYNPPVPEPPAPYMQVYHAPPEVIVGQQNKAQPWRRSLTLRVTHKIRQRRQRSNNGSRRIIAGISIALLFVVLFGGFGGSAYAYSYYQQELPVVDNLAKLNAPQNTRIYDRNGVLLYEAYDHNPNDVNAGRHINVSYSQIPMIMQEAMIAAEDNTFWTNNGINPTAILRAASSGNGGGSTITQQVIKNITHNSSYTLTRKVTEAAMALALTQQYPKWKILEMYFNVAPFGTYDNGVETAAENLFHLKRVCSTKTYECTAGISQIAKDSNGKSDPLLGLARASLLASIPNNPTIYDPSVDDINFQRVLTRQDYVLNQMMNQGMTVDGTKTGTPITSAVIKQVEALTTKMKFSSYNSVKQAPYFVDWVMYQVAHVLDPEDLANGYSLFQTSGLNIYTTVDVNLEKYVETSIHDNLDTEEYQLFPAADAGYKIISQVLDVNDAAAVVEDAKTGEILAMDGGSDYNNSDLKVGGEYNTAAPPDDGNGYDPTTSTYDPSNLSQTPTIGRQPGSTMKPIEYAAAFEDGWYPNMELPDGVTFFPNGSAAGTTIPTGTAQERVANSDGSHSYPNLSSAAANVGLYAPTDYGQTFHNTTTGKTATITYATANSFNIPALKAMAYVGPQNVLNMARRMGIDTLHSSDNGINGIAWALGTKNVPLIQMVGAYQTFADNGKHLVPQGILDIYDNYGHDLFHYDPNHPQGAQVISPQVAFMITSILRDEPDRYDEFGSDPDLSFTDFDSSCLYSVTCNYQMAAKTGTSDAFVDNMTVGYTPDVVVGVWAGNANGQAMANNTVGITGAAPIFNDIIENVSGFCPTRHISNDCPKYNFEFSSNPTRQFTAPDGLVQSDVSGTSGLLGSGSGYAAYMLPNQVPTQSGIAVTTTTTTTKNGK